VKYYVTIEDRVVEIDLDDTSGGWTGTIEGHTYGLDLVATAGDALFSFIVDGQSHELLVEDVPGGVEILVGGELFHIVVQDEWERRLANIQRKTAVESGETVVKAPMPGAVVGVAVAVGDAVKRGQGLVVLSAMKMENEIRSPRDGTIIGVHVAEGDKVDQSADLVTIGTAELA
jgi:acetyl/propionyl-CoA carboxylase alpha subunit